MQPEGGWKKLNTLGHYNVPDSAQLNLIPKQSSLSDMSDKSHLKSESPNLSKFSFASPLLSQTSPLLNHDNEAGVKVGTKVCYCARQVRA